MENYFIAISVVVAGSALLAWIACRTHQPVILGYFLCGVLIGPFGLKWVPHIELLEHISRIGVTLLLFLAGLVLHPDRLRRFFRTAATVTLGGSVLSWLLVTAVLRVWGFSLGESSLAGLALMFSSTILVVKLLPTTTLHQKHMGSICIAVLIAQDLLAIILLTLLGAERGGDGGAWFLLWLPVKAVLLIALAIAGEQYVLRPMMRAADRYAEVLDMLCLGWCLGIAVVSQKAGLSYEVGAFVAGVAMSRGKIARILSERLKPLRDFFLMFFFFVLGAKFDVYQLRTVWLPTVVVAGLILVSRPLYMRWLLRRAGEESKFSGETAFRMGQASEFALIVAVAAVAGGHLSKEMSQLIQAATILTMVVSSCLVVLRFPTPIGVTPTLQRD